MLLAAGSIGLGLGGPGFVPGAGAQVDPATSTTTTTASTTTTTASTTTTTAVPGSTTTTTTEATPTTLAPIVPGVVPSSGTRSTADQIKELNSRYDELTADELDVLTRYLRQQDKAKTLADQADALESSVSALAVELASAQGRVDRAESHAADVEDRIADSEDQLDREQERLRQQAVQAYMGGGLGDGMASANAVLKTGSVNDLGATVVYADAVAGDQRQVIRRVADLRARVTDLRAEADRARTEAVQARDDVAARSAVITQQRDQNRVARQQADDAAAAEQALLVEVSQKRSDYLARLSLATAASGGIAGTLHDRQVGQQLPLVTAGMFAPPLTRAVVSSGYGPRPDPFGGPPRVHQGIDFSATSGTPILASADGVVVIASDQSGYGNCTVIDHGNGLATLYGHQSRYNVEIGDKVTRGQVIGFVGSTGHSTGPHLHWEVREFGQPVDPVPFLGNG